MDLNQLFTAIQNLVGGPPKFGVGQVAPGSVADWSSLQRWLTNLYSVLSGQTMTQRSFSFNLAYDTQGTPDTRPGTWGYAGYVDVPIPFENVPAGSTVQLVNLQGTHQAWPQNTNGTPAAIPAGSNAGVLFGFLITGSGQSPYVGAGLGSEGCPLYVQNQIGPYGCLIPFDWDFEGDQVTLAADNVLTMRLAVFLNNTGASIHQEISGVLTFQYA